MDNLARGWAIAWTQMHGHPAVWIAVMAGVATAIWLAVWSERRKPDDDDANDPRPKRRAPFPGPDRGFRP